mmetsp:Transcript_4257/g.15934  ORF Transcript_4257/g.15934 Transcript_4257/m.15934 type:complete len:361 (+) Transcript_4257:130-1212(+)
MSSWQDPVWDGGHSRWSASAIPGTAASCGGAVGDSREFNALAALFGLSGDGGPGRPDSGGPVLDARPPAAPAPWGVRGVQGGGWRNPPADNWGGDTASTAYQVAVAAAAAIAQPAEGKQHGARPSGPAWPNPEAQMDQIRQAQLVAERRRRGGGGGGGAGDGSADVYGAQQQAASLRAGDIDERIRSAQLRVSTPAAYSSTGNGCGGGGGWGGCCGCGGGGNGCGGCCGCGGGGGGGGWGGSGYSSGSGCGSGPYPSSPTSARWDMPSGSKPLGPEDLLGNWVDMQGNSVMVCSTDAWELRLTASMSRPNRPDLNLSVRPSPSGGWLCGTFELDPMVSSPERLTWYAPDGRMSSWMRGRE